MCDMTHSYAWHDSFICVTWLIHTCDMTHSYVWHDSFICDMTHSYMSQEAFTCVTWLVYMCDMTHSYAWHDSFICVTWLINMWRDSFIYVIRRNHMCDVTSLWLDLSMCSSRKSSRVFLLMIFLWHDSFICVTWLIHMWRDSFIYVIRRNHMCDMIHSYTCINLSVVAWHPKEKLKEWVMLHVWISHVKFVSNSIWEFVTNSCLASRTHS